MKYFTIAELTRSTTAQKMGIDNTPTPAAVQNLRSLVENVLDPLREAYGHPIYVNSGYRCKALNKAVGGSRTSQHMYGLAADITTRSREKNEQLAEIIKRELPFDQLIYYNEDGSGPSFLHVSIRPDGSDIPNRRQVLHKCSK